MDSNNQDSSQEENPIPIKNKSFIWALIPKGDYFFTPIILCINISVFILMIITGVSAFIPSANSLITWGANYRPLTMGAEPWRLFTSMFLHFGIIHLAANMFALFSIGKMLEPFIGRWRFFILYLLAGLGGNAVSLWWHQNDPSVSAGASGAIFGLFGVLTALLTTNLIDATVRKSLMKSMATAITLNLLIGLYAGIDNSAHLGGLLTGAMGGWLCYFDLKSFYENQSRKYTGLLLTALVTIGIVVFFWMIIPNNLPITKNEVLFEHYTIEEKNSIDFIDKIDSSTTAEQIQNKAVIPWQHNLTIVDSIKQNGLNEDGEMYFNQLRIYTLLRLKGADEYFRAAKEKRMDLRDSARKSMTKADETILDLQEKIE